MFHDEGEVPRTCEADTRRSAPTGVNAPNEGKAHKLKPGSDEKRKSRSLAGWRLEPQSETLAA
jgi:hypothetical protein